MTDFVAIPAIPGAITAALLDDLGDLPGPTFPEERILEGWQPVLIDASTSGSVVLELRSAIGGGGTLVATATFLAGSDTPDSVLASGTILAGTSTFLRITSVGADAGGLSGNLLLKSFASFSGVTQQLTTSAIVKAFDPALDDFDQTVIDRVISGVSDRMVKYMQRQINIDAGRVEFPTVVPGIGTDVRLADWPVTSVVVLEGAATLVVDTDYRVDADKGVLTRLSANGFKAFWPDSRVQVTYDAGYAEVPEGLVELATWQCAAELHRTQNREIGISQRDPEAGATLTWEPDGFLTSVLQGMQSWRRIQ